MATEVARSYASWLLHLGPHEDISVWNWGRFTSSTARTYFCSGRTHLAGLHIIQFFVHSALSNWCGIPHLTRFWLEPGPPHTSHLVMTSISLAFLLPDDIFPLLVRALAMIGEGVVGTVSVLDVATNIWGPDNDEPSPTGIGIGFIYNKWNMLNTVIQIKIRK